MSTAVLTHIRIDDNGGAWIDDANVKVVEVVVRQMAYGWIAEELHFQHPDLSMAQVHAALGHYHDHQAEFDAEIERQLAKTEAWAAEAKDTRLRKRLRSEGRLRRASGSLAARDHAQHIEYTARNQRILHHTR